MCEQLAVSDLTEKRIKADKRTSFILQPLISF